MWILYYVIFFFAAIWGVFNGLSAPSVSAGLYSRLDHFREESCGLRGALGLSKGDDRS